MKIPVFPILIIFSFVLWLNHIIGKPDKVSIDIMTLWHHQLLFLHFTLIGVIVLGEFYKILKDKNEN